MRRIIVIAIATVVLSVVATGCVEKSRRLSPAEKQKLKTLVTKTAPTPGTTLDVKFEDKVRLIGYDFDKASIRPGEPFSVTWYWKVEKDLGDGWLLFTHIVDAKNISRINADADRAIRHLHPAEDWKAGEYIKDVQELVLPVTWTSPEVRLYMGLWNGPHRMHITKGPDDGEHRTLALTIPVRTLPKYVAHPVTGEIEIDGKLDEPDWKKAKATSAFKNTRTGEKGAFKASSRLMYDAKHLYAAFEVTDTLLKSSFENRDDHLWEQDAVEIMVDPDGDGKNYFEIQVAPSGVVFDTRYDSPRKPQPLGHLDWDCQAVAKVETKGKLNDEDADEGYVVEMAIPWQAFATGTPPAKAPRAREIWRVNLFVMDTQKAGQQTVGWSPPRVSDFHTLDRFGRLEFPKAMVETSKEQAVPGPSDSKKEEPEESKPPEEKPTAKP
jgi:hypothetical protein